MKQVKHWLKQDQFFKIKITETCKLQVSFFVDCYANKIWRVVLFGADLYNITIKEIFFDTLAVGTA